MSADARMTDLLKRIEEEEGKIDAAVIAANDAWFNGDLRTSECYNREVNVIRARLTRLKDDLLRHQFKGKNAEARRRSSDAPRSDI